MKVPKFPFFFKVHLNQSPPPKKWRKSSIGPTSQSFESRVNLTSQVLLSPSLCLGKDKATEASLSMASSYKTGNVIWRGWSPHQQSCQNFTLFPIPISNRVCLLKSSQPIRMSLHKPQPWTPLPNLEVHPPIFPKLHSYPPPPKLILL